MGRRVSTAGAGQIVVPGRVLDAVKAWSETVGLNMDEAIELAVRTSPIGSLLPGAAPEELTASAEALRQLQAGGAVEPGRISAALQARGVFEDIIAIRLGSLRPADDPPGGPFRRKSIGADITSPINEIWGAARGYWRHNGSSRVLVAMRLGVPIAVFSGIIWGEHAGLRYAVSGYGVVDGRKISLTSGRRDLGVATAQDKLIEKIAMAHPILTPSGSRNPMCWLSRRA